MGLPALEADVLALRFSKEFMDTPAPYYGVNIIEVNNENWHAFVEETKKADESIKTNLGGHCHLWTVRDHGDRKKVLYVNYYPENVGHLNTQEIFQMPEVRDFWLGWCALVERWEWFVTSEEPSAPV